MKKQRIHTSKRGKVGGFKANAGFSLFELVVFIISVAIIYAAAARRFTDFPGEAERANFFAVTTQIQAGVNLEMMLGITRGNGPKMQAFANANPMDLLLDPPSNYIGVLSGISGGDIDKRIWYFDSSRRELVYLVNDAEGVFLLVNGSRVPTEEIRFSLVVKYRYEDKLTGLPVELFDDAEDRISSADVRRTVSGLVLEPVLPFEWGANLDLLDEASAIQT